MDLVSATHKLEEPILKFVRRAPMPDIQGHAHRVLREEPLATHKLGGILPGGIGRSDVRGIAWCDDRLSPEAGHEHCAEASQA